NNWALLDFNDKDQEGNNKIREIVVDYDLKHELGKLKVKEIKGEDEKFALLHRLERGMRVPVTLRNDRKDQVYFIQADPVRKSNSIFESSDSSVTVAPI